jgi:hypothetical protein
MAGMMPPDAPDGLDNTADYPEPNAPNAGGRTSGVRRESSAPMPMPAPWPDAAPDDASELDDVLTPEPSQPPVIAPGAWLDKPRYWLEDYQPVKRPTVRSINKPKRFHKPSFWRSAFIVVVLTLAFSFTITGALVVMRTGNDLYNSFTPTPAPSVTPAPAPSPTHAPTATPKPKKKHK